MEERGINETKGDSLKRSIKFTKSSLTDHEERRERSQ